jgi:hypothetical protein
MRIILVGYGEIGKAVEAVYKDHCEMEVFDTNLEEAPEGEFDLMFVAFPYTERFNMYVKEYFEAYNVKGIVIFSTVQIGTCNELHKDLETDIIHSPVVGKHPDLENSIRIHMRWVGGRNSMFETLTKKALGSDRMLVVEDPKVTESLKLLSTTLYALNIEYARFAGEVLGDKYDLFKEWNRHYNELYDKLGLSQYKKYILEEPEGLQGGHCTIPNAQILNDYINNEFSNLIINKNK